MRLRALGLDYSGWVLVNGKMVGTFVGTFVPHIFDITQDLRERDNVLQIVFDTPPRWLGQIGYTSQMTEWKARFNYFWDWTSRLVQLGIWNDLLLEVTDGEELLALQVVADALHGHARLRASGMISGEAGARCASPCVRRPACCMRRWWTAPPSRPASPGNTFRWRSGIRTARGAAAVHGAVHAARLQRRGARHAGAARRLP